MRARLDAELVRRGMVVSRAEAQEAVQAGIVRVSGRYAGKASMLVDRLDPIVLDSRVRRFVSRGGDKLAAGLDRFHIEPDGLDCLDAGASTGGFTDCLLARGAKRVLCVDVGYGQLAWSLRSDPRVTVLERTNIRDLPETDLPFRPSLVVVDLSFISLRTVLPALASSAEEEAGFLMLVKPQFEAGRDKVGKGGVVRDPAVWREVIEGLLLACRRAGVSPRGLMASPLLGPAGNVEFLLDATLDGKGAEVDLEGAIFEGIALKGTM